MYVCIYVDRAVRGTCCPGVPSDRLVKKTRVRACVRACVLSRFLKASRAKPSIPAPRGKSKLFSGNRSYHWRRDEDLASSYLSSPRWRLADVTGRCSRLNPFEAALTRRHVQFAEANLFHWGVTAPGLPWLLRKDGKRNV